MHGQERSGSQGEGKRRGSTGKEIVTLQPEPVGILWNPGFGVPHFRFEVLHLRVTHLRAA